MTVVAEGGRLAFLDAKKFLDAFQISVLFLVLSIFTPEKFQYINNKMPLWIVLLNILNLLHMYIKRLNCTFVICFLRFVLFSQH